jgi:LPS-assembly protein
MMFLRAIMGVVQPGPARCSITLALLFGLMLSAAAVSKLAAQQGSQRPPQSPEVAGTFIIHADAQEITKDTSHLRGHVEITYQDVKLTADEVIYEANSGDVEAKGHVLFIDPQSHLAADEVHYNLRTKKGWFSNSQGFVHARVHPRSRMLTTENPFYVHAARVERSDEDTYWVERGRLTTCECEEKGWSISARRAKVEVDQRLVTHGALFRMFRVPFFYAPVFVNSIARTPRQTGFLLPHVGNSSVKGVIIGDGFFWAVNPSVDLLLGLENYSIRGLAPRGEFRAKPSENSELVVDYFNVRDKGSGPMRESKAPGQSLQMTGKAADLGYGFRGVVNVDYITSMPFRLTWAENFTQAVNSEARQMGFLTKDFGPYSLNLLASRYQDFFPAAQGPGNSSATSPSSTVSYSSVGIRQTPTVSLSRVDQQVGQSAFYFSFEASAGAVGRQEPGLSLPAVSERLDFHPEITLRSKPFWGFHLTPLVGFRSTRYGTSLKADHEPVNRLLGEFSVDLRPPSLEKVLAKPYHGHRLKHIIEPDVRYDLVRAHRAGDITDLVRFDEMDIFAETNEIEYSLTNTILVRKDAPEGAAEVPQARELISLRLSQKYYFDPTFGGALTPGQNVFEPTISLTGFAFAQGRRLSPVVSVLKFSPFSSYDTELRTDLSPNGGVLNAGITSNIHHGPLGLAFTDFFINRTAALSTPLAPNSPVSLLPSFHLLQTVATYGNTSRKGFSGAFGVTYNLAKKNAPQAVGQVSYNFGCFALDLEYRHLALGSLRRETQFRVALSFANVGTFGNLKPRERLY